MAKFCKKCGNELNDNAMFCPKCGTKFEAQPVQQPVQQPAQNAAPAKQPEATKEKKKFPVAAIIAIVLVIAIVAGYFAMAGIYKWQPLGDNKPFSFSTDDDESTTGESEKDGKDGKKDSGDKENSSPFEDNMTYTFIKEEDNTDITESENSGDKNEPSDNGGAGGTLSVGDVGSYVTFGKYEQDNDTSNGKEDIEWLVLAKENGKALLISKYELDHQKYNEELVDVTWETCTLRTWLNDDFMNDAFSSSEQSKIITSTVVAEKNSEYATDPGNDTSDKVFLLSQSEANKYFSSDDERICAPTAYATAQGAYASSSYKTADGEPAGYWWLRTSGYSIYNACFVNITGYVSDDGSYVYTSNFGVRPALWINL